jgi:S-DNA-T family DNA segregation ATPase FtsK/SpoIIIE
MMYYIGPGVFILLISGVCFLGIKLGGGKISQPVFRFIGLGFLVVAGSSSYYCLWPDKFFRFPVGSGGLLGVGTTYFLRDHFALLGTFILIAAIWVVGSVLLADHLVRVILHSLSVFMRNSAGLFVPAWRVAKERSSVLGEIWQKLSARQETERETDLFSSSGAKAGSYFVEDVKNDSLEQARGESSEVKVTSQKVERSPKPFVPKSYENYTLPPLELLDEPEYGYSAVQSKVIKSKAAALEQLLSEFGIEARVVAADTGPVITMFELELSAGVKVGQISSLSNDIARALGAGVVRIVAPMPGKHTIGIEVPNSEKEKVRMKDIAQLCGNRSDKMYVPLFLGKDSSGEALVSDLAQMPHLLIAGTTGSGKSVCINSIISSVLLTRRPDEVKMILIDPKMVEMTAFNNVPHLLSPIVTEIKRAVQILEWATVKMDERYALLAEAKVKNIAGYNNLGQEEIIERFNPSTPDEEAKIPKRLAYIVIIIDELADLMMTAAKEIEAYIVRLAQKSRAVGIHLVVATQRPQATVVTGLIKSNMPTRIGFRVAARMDSRIILDQNGAETLLGQGDMLFLKPGTSDLIRAQGTFLDDMEIKRIVKHLKEVAEPQFHPELMQLGRLSSSDMPKDELFDEAVRIVLGTKRGSVSLLQRRLSIGYARASRIIEMMGVAGILGEYKGSQAREVLVTAEEYEEMREGIEEEDDYRGTDDDYEEEEEEGKEGEQSYLNQGQREYISADDEP